MSETLEQVISNFEHAPRGIPQAHMAARLVAELRAALAASIAQPECTPQADSVLEDAERWQMAVLVGKEVMLHPANRTHQNAVKAYMDAVHSGLDLTGAVDAARKQGGA